jgi:hypothetical protein
MFLTIVRYLPLLLSIHAFSLARHCTSTAIALQPMIP